MYLAKSTENCQCNMEEEYRGYSPSKYLKNGKFRLIYLLRSRAKLKDYSHRRTAGATSYVASADTALYQ